MRANERAAYIHKRMCEDPRFGYSWEERYGSVSETWTIGGKKYQVRVGDYDCSSSCITAWAIALRGTKYEGCLKDATYTGNMREVFVGSGLFTWKPMSFLACPGDLYLNEENHVAMCQTQVPDVLSEFSWGDNGAYGNRRGDQSGAESSVHGYYDYEPGGWDGILHYNGKADEMAFTDGTYVTTVERSPVRAERKAASAWCCTLGKGCTVKLKNFKKNSAGNTWAEIASGDHKGRFILAATRKGARIRRK